MAHVSTASTTAEFDSLIQDQKVTWVVEFGATWSEGSKQMAEVVDELAKEVDPATVRFVRLEAESVPEISLRYKVKAVPTFVFLQGGAETGRVDGVHAAALTTKVRQCVASPSLPPLPARVSVAAQGASLEDRLKDLIKKSRVMVFMKGNPLEPRCGFSRQMVDILNKTGESYGHFDIFADEEVRDGLKKFSNWPTYPQLYVDGELIGGLDIVKEMVESGELADAVKAPKAQSLDDRLKGLIKKAPVMVFMKGVPQMPKCKFSRALMDILHEEKVEFSTFDILEDNDVREGLKKLSNWPTYPQVYVKGELIGGIDIIKISRLEELKETGELKASLAGQ